MIRRPARGGGRAASHAHRGAAGDHDLVGRSGGRPSVRPGALRLLVADRIEGITEGLTDLRARLLCCEQAAAEFEAKIRENDGLRRMVVPASVRFGAETVADVVQAGLTHRDSLAAERRRGTALEERIAGMRQQHTVLRILADQLDGVADLDQAVIPDQVARNQQATRQVFDLIDDEYDRAEGELLAGPLQVLTDLVLETEVLGRSNETMPSAAQLGEICNQARRAHAELARFAGGRHPPALDRRGLVDAVSALAIAIGEDAGIAVQVHVVGAERRLDRATLSVLYRIIRESLDNAAAHSGAAAADVVLTFTSGTVAVVIRDCGEGFDVAATEAMMGRTRGMGLISMREFARAAGARVEIRSQVGVGSEVRVRVSVDAG